MISDTEDSEGESLDEVIIENTEIFGDHLPPDDVPSVDGGDWFFEEAMQKMRELNVC